MSERKSLLLRVSDALRALSSGGGKKAASGEESRAIISTTYPNFPAGAQQMQLVRTADPSEYRRDGRTVRVQGFNAHPVVHACIRTITDIVATIPLVVLQEKGDMESRVPESHPLQQLLDYPGARFTARQFRSTFAVNFLGYGNAFFVMERPGISGRIRGLRPVNAESIQQVWIDTEGDPRRYDYANWAGQIVQVPVENMLHFRDIEMGRPFEADVFGYPRGATAIGSMLSDNEATQYVRQVVTNDGTPTFAVLMSDEATTEDALAMQERYVARTVDRGKRGTPAFFGAVKDIKPIGFTLHDLEFPDLRRISREDICAAFGVDPRMIGIASASNDSGLSGAQYEEARARLIQHTIEPLLGAFEDELNHWLAPEYGNVWVSYDHDMLRDLVENDNETSTRIREELKIGLRTWEESRRALRLSPVPEPTDTVVQTVGVTFVPASKVVIDPSAIPSEPPATDNEVPSNAPTQAEDDAEDEVEDEPEDELEETLDEDRAEKVTNFPERGDNKKVTLRNSQYALFPVGEAEDLKENWPDIWRKGGNIKGNEQFAKLAPLAKRGGVPDGEAEENAIRLREAWIARHTGDHQLAGVVAQIKWLAVGSRGIDHMRAVIRKAKEASKGRSDTQPRTMEEKRAYWERAMDELDSTEEAFRAQAREQFKREEAAIAALIRMSASPDEAIDRVQRFFNITESNAQDWERAFGPLITETYAKGSRQVAGAGAILAAVLLGDQQWQSIVSVTELQSLREFVLRAIQERTKFLANYVGQTTASEISAAIRAGMLGDLSLDEIARLVGKAVYGEERVDWRTRLIAKTEAAGAMSQGSWDQARQSGLFVTKEWVTFQDNRVRDSHLDCMAQGPIPMEQLFANGLMYPFQPGAPADEVINCRCVLAYSDGLV